MNIIVGMIRPETNCARNDASYSFSFSSAKVRSIACWRPKTLTRSWPEKVSSMWALSLPVLRHWAMNWPCERFMILAVTNIETGTETSAISASSGEIQNIVDSTATTVSSEVSSWLIVCCRVWLTLSMSLVTRLSSSPRGCWSKYSSGSALTLSSTSPRIRRTVFWTTSLSR